MKLFSEIREIAELHGNRDYPFEDHQQIDTISIEEYRRLVENQQQVDTISMEEYQRLVEERQRASVPKILPKEVIRQIREGHITLAQYVEERQKRPIVERAALSARPVCHRVVELAALNAKPVYSQVIEVAAIRH